MGPMKTNSFNILPVLLTLVTVKAEWDGGEANIISSKSHRHTQMYIGNDEIAHYFFSSSTKNNSLVLEGIYKCLDNFQLITCVKMLLLSRVNDVMSLVEEPNAIESDLHALNGIFTFAVKNTTNSISGENYENLNLDEEIALKVKRIFHKRSLLINLFPNTKIQIEPSYDNSKDNILSFDYAIKRETEAESVPEVEGRKKSKGGMPMMMIVPPLIMMGLMPFTLASLKAMVMNAVMINMMALNGAIFMTIRNLVFGPRKGDNVKYVNYGYSKDRQTQSRRPVLIIHSPAAFVKQPPVNRNRRPSTSHHIQSHNPHNHFSTNSYQHHNENYAYEFKEQHYTSQGNNLHSENYNH